MKRNLLAVLLLALSVPAQAENLETCQYGVMLAQKAYLSGTFDAQRPNIKDLTYLVDYWGDMMIVPADRDVAQRAVKYIAERMKNAGIRRPNEAIMYEPVRESIITECGRYYVQQ